MFGGASIMPVIGYEDFPYPGDLMGAQWAIIVRLISPRRLSTAFGNSRVKIREADSFFPSSSGVTGRCGCGLLAADRIFFQWSESLLDGLVKPDYDEIVSFISP